MNRAFSNEAFKPEPSEKTSPSLCEAEICHQDLNAAKIAASTRLLGRTALTEEGLQCDFVATGISFRAHIGAELRFRAISPADAYFTVFADGERLPQRYVARGSGTVTVSLPAKPQETCPLRHIEIIKQNEAIFAPALLLSLSYFGSPAMPTEEKDLYLEFLGDSITGGSCNLLKGEAPAGGPDHNSSIWQDGTLAYSYLTARALDADVSIINRSGIGVHTGWSNQDGSGFNMDRYWPCRSFVRSEEQMDFSQARVPDAVIINLGTNDVTFPSEEAPFQKSVADLIRLVRTSYGVDMPIVWAYNMMCEGYSGRVKTVFAALGGEEKGLYTVSLTRNTEGGIGHPSVAGHAVCAKELAAFLRTRVLSI